MNTVIQLILMIIVALFSAYLIRTAIVRYHKREYFICGVNIACAVWELAYLVKWIFES